MPRLSGKHAALMLVVAAATAAGIAAATFRAALPDAREARPADVGAAPAPSPPSPRGAEAFAPSETAGGVGRAPHTTPLPMAAAPQTDVPPGHAFYFTRVAYSGWGRGWWGGGGSWRTDFPKADLQFLAVLNRLIDIDAYPAEHAIALDDPAIRRFPFLYALEVGGMDLTEVEVRNLRDYLLAGGFLVIDDFWGPREWANFEHNIRRVLPGREIVDLPMDHPIFTTFYEIDEVLQVPSIGNIRRGQTSEKGGVTPHVRGILDDKDRLMVLINFNTDLGDAWEWAEQPDYPLMYSTYAFQMGVNFVVYAMSH